MSDMSQGPGWWQASDRKWYPPEAVPGSAPEAVPGSAPEPVAPTGWTPGPVGPAMAGTPSSALRAPRTRSATTTGGGWALVLLVSGVVMIVGSIGSWLTISTFSVSDSAGGTSHGGEGWISLVAGIVLIVVGLLGIVAGGNGLRVVGLMGAVASGAGLGISIYFCERFLSAPGSGVGHLGWGLILVLLTSLVSLVAAVLVTLAAD